MTWVYKGYQVKIKMELTFGMGNKNFVGWSLLGGIFSRWGKNEEILGWRGE